MNTYIYNLYIEARGGMLKYMNWYVEPKHISNVPYGKYGKQVCIMDSHMVSPSTIDRRPNVCSISREVWGIVSVDCGRPASLSVLACKWQTLKSHICIVRCKQFACSEPAENILQAASSIWNGPLCILTIPYLPYLPYGRVVSIMPYLSS